MRTAATRIPLLMAAVVGAASLLSACSSGAPNGLTLYNGQHPQTTDALVSAFEEESGITVHVRNGDEDVLANQIVSEGSASPADLVYTENSPALEYLQSQHLLAAVDATTLERVPARYNSPDGEWVGVSGRVSMLVYNTTQLHRGQLPSSVLGLALPRWQGLLGLAPSETDFQPIVTSVLRQQGRAATLRWLTGLKANAGSHIYPDNESLVAAVNAGQVALGVINQYYWYRLRVDLGPGGMHSALAPFADGDPGYVVNVSGAAVLRSSHDQSAAQRFLAFLVSPQGQHIIAAGDSFEYPLATESASATSAGFRARGGPPLDELHPNDITVAQIGDGAEARQLLQEVQLQ
jgi:iron(III) transport system substrate-binding protein